jgi:acyl transferase domain-containing protein/acyl carrier protein
MMETDENAMENSPNNGARTGLEVAVIGFACRFPGAEDAAQFWENLSTGVESISRFSEQELREAGVPPAVVSAPNYVCAAGVLGSAALFDAHFFGISPKEAEMMDPQHRHFLECSWAALEQAGWDPRRYSGRIGVYAGSGINTYFVNNVYSNRALRQAAGPIPLLIGSDKDFLPTRVSFKLGLEGPSIAVQTACSSSLVATHLACQSLLSGDCDMALAGGVSIRSPEARGYVYEEGMIFSPDGHCRPFDANARGTVPSNGVGIVVLKRLEEALSDRDCIYAVIRGSAVNNDGAAKVGYTTPRVEGQARVLRAAYKMAEVDPRTVSYVEAHGSGTTVGDAVELTALQKIFGERADGGQDRVLGSVKGNIGHADTAAGVAGLIKTVLALHHRTLPPTLHFERANPELKVEDGAFCVRTSASEWKSGAQPRRAGVSSFGLGGTNAHVVLEEAPAVPESRAFRSRNLLLLSARTPQALDSAALRLANHLQATPDVQMADVAFTLAAGRRPFEQRRAVVCTDRDTAIQALLGRAPERVSSAVASNEPASVAFLFSGAGDQYVGMAHGLYESEARFRETLDRCVALLLAETGKDFRSLIFSNANGVDRDQSKPRWDLRAMLQRPARSVQQDDLARAELAHPALFALEYALADLWMYWGVRPAALLGYSLGELVAACIAGVISLQDALTVVCRRAQLFESLPEGAMLAVSLPEAEVGRYLGGEVCLGAVNGPGMTVLSGSVPAMSRLREVLDAEGISSRWVQSTRAFHSPMTEPIRAAYTDLLSSVRLSPPQIRLISNVTGTWTTDEQATDPAYWATQMCAPVQFERALGELWNKTQLLLEIGPGQSLSSLALQHPGAAVAGAVAVASLPHAHQGAHDCEFILRSMGKLWLAGAELDWSRVHGDAVRRVGLPTYPFERQTYWLEANDGKELDGDASRGVEVSEWFYLPSWRRAVVPRLQGRLDGSEPRHWAIFHDDEGVGDHLRLALLARGCSVTSVRRGTRFEMHGTDCALDPHDANHCEQLLDALLATGVRAIGLAHLWGVTSRAGFARGGAAEFSLQQEQGYGSLIALARALARAHSAELMRLVVVSSGVHAIGSAVQCDAEGAPRVAIASVIRQELPSVDVRQVDIDENDVALMPANIVREMVAPAAEPSVAYRGPNRFLPSFEAVRIERSEAESKQADGEIGAAGPLREQGVYWILGGLGSVGLTLAEHLARRVRARLVLTSRSPFPPRGQWDAWLEEHDGVGRVSAVIRALLRVEQFGSSVQVVQADLTDESAMHKLMLDTLERHGVLHGIVHAAGAPAAVTLLSEQSVAATEAQFGPKCRGLYVLEDVVGDRVLDFVVLFSSTAALFGGVGLGAYAAASSFMNHFAQRKSATSQTPWLSLDWDGWRTDNLEQADLERSSIGALFMSPEEALDAFERVLGSGLVGPVVVSRKPIERRQEGGGAGRTAAASPAPRHEEPQTDAERAVAAIWHEVLGTSKIGVHDSFFELGGDSLLGTKVIAKAKQAFGIALPLRELWRNPTIAKLALVVEEMIIDELLTKSSVAASDGEELGE